MSMNHSEEASLSGTAPVPSISRHAGAATLARSHAVPPSWRAAGGRVRGAAGPQAWPAALALRRRGTGPPSPPGRHSEARIIKLGLG